GEPVTHPLATLLAALLVALRLHAEDDIAVVLVGADDAVTERVHERIDADRLLRALDVDAHRAEHGDGEGFQQVDLEEREQGAPRERLGLVTEELEGLGTGGATGSAHAEAPPVAVHAGQLIDLLGREDAGELVEALAHERVVVVPVLEHELFSLYVQWFR